MRYAEPNVMKIDPRERSHAKGYFLWSNGLNFKYSKNRSRHLSAFGGEPSQRHCGSNEISGIYDNKCKQLLPKIIPPDSSTASAILLFYQFWYLLLMQVSFQSSTFAEIR
jgi:hypothetical protein